MPKRQRIDATWVVRGAAALQRAGYSGDRALREAGLSPAAVTAEDARISYYRFAAFLEAAARLSGQPYFGLEIGRDTDPRESGLLGYIAASSPTLATAVRNCIRYLRVHNEGVAAALVVSGSQAEIVLRISDPRVESPRQAAEFHVSLVHAALGQLSGKSVPLQAVRFAHPRPDEPAPYRQVLGVEPQFSGPDNRLLLPHRWLEDTAIATADARLLRILTGYADSVLAQRPRPDDMVARVRALVADRLSDGVPAAAEVASELAVSPRTLSRRLAAQSCSYRSIVDDVRRELALHYLTDPDLRLSQIAFLLGYAEIGAFTHAFRRWTGHSPSQHRRQTLAA